MNNVFVVVEILRFLALNLFVKADFKKAEQPHMFCTN